MRYSALLLAISLPLCAEVRVFKNFTLIDGTGRQPAANSAMIVDNGRITWVGPVGQLKAPAGAETLDIAGKFVMPGIINLHGHLGNTLGLVQDPKNFTRQNLDQNLKTYAAYGVTTVVSMGSDQELVYQVRSEQRAGRPKLTRIYTAGRGFTGEAGYPTTAPGMKGVPFEVKTPAEAAADVAQNAGKKVDIIKIWVDDHLGKQQKIRLDLAKAIIAAAHKNNIKVGAHIFYLDDAKQLVAAGLDGLAHSVRDKPVDAELINLMKSKGAWQQAPTLTREVSVFIYGHDAPPFLTDPFFTKSVDAKTLSVIKSPEYKAKAKADPDYAKYPAFLETAKQNLKKLVDAGVKYGFGTDTGPPARFPGYFEHWEMELMKDSGLTPMQILTAATKNSAEFLGAKDLGTLESGKWADMIVLSKNPLQDIRNTRSIEQVWIAGNRAN